MEALLRSLNGAQRAAVTSPASVLQVLAPPGSGKTKTLTSRVAYLLEHHGYAPWNIICCTFTIKASKEMRERLRGIVGDREAKLQLGTFHSICRRYLVRYGHLIDIPQNFGIADASDSLSIIKRAVKRLSLTIDPKVARNRISFKKSKGFRLEEVLKAESKTAEAQEFHTVFTEYENALAASNLLDYDDLLIRCSDLLRAHPECVSNIEALLIDEFQDTNVIQFELMKLLASARKRITVVGDPDQSIYGFRSAEIENLHRMRLAYPDTAVINLEENYRSSTAILKLAQDVIEQDTDRPEKKMKATHCYGTLPVFRKLPNAYEEARWIAIEIKRITTMTAGLVQYSDIAILLRSAYLSLKIEKELARNAVPYRMVGGHKFFDRIEIRTLLGYLRTISQPENDPALVAIINVPSRKIGEVTVKEWLYISQQKKISLWLTLQQILSGEIRVEKKLSKTMEQKLREFVDFVKRARKKILSIEQPFMVPLELLTLIIDHIKFRDYLKIKYHEDHEDRWENVQELLSQATDFAAGEAANRVASEELPTIEGLAQREVAPGEETLAQYLANIVLSSEIETSEEGQNKPRVTISTIHSAKGLEWPVVFVPAAFEGSMPHSRAEDMCEERRLLYVAITRAQALLNVTFPLLAPDQSEHVLSQFLRPQIAGRFAQTAPVFCDRTIDGMASTMRRDHPPETAVIDIRLNYSAGLESSNDDLWPADGSTRPAQYQDLKSAMYETQHKSIAQRPQPGIGHDGNSWGKVLEDRLSGQVLGGNTLTERQRQPGTGGFTTARRHMSSFQTTMDSAQEFSIPPKIGGTFLGARKAFGSGIAHSIQERSKTKPQGNVAKLTPPTMADFFAKKPPKFTVGVASVESAVSSMSTNGPCVIPQEFSSHTLSAKVTTLKRPCTVLEEMTSPNRKRGYLFLSSSPGHDFDPSEPHQAVTGSADDPLHLSNDDLAAATVSSVQDENSLQKIGADLKMVRRQYQEHITPGQPLYRPIATMHTTVMSTLLSNTPVRKTLGLGRPMNGWNNRRHK